MDCSVTLSPPGVRVSRGQDGELLVDSSWAVTDRDIQRSKILSDLHDELDGDTFMPVQADALKTWLQYSSELDMDPATLVTVMQVAEFLQDESTVLAVSLQLSAAIRQINRASFQPTFTVYPAEPSCSSSRMPSQGARCLDHLAATSTNDQESNNALTRILKALHPLSVALLSMVLSHLHPLEQSHVLHVASTIAAIEAINDAFVQLSRVLQQQIHVARAELHLFPLAPSLNVLRHPSPDVAWRNRISHLFQTHTYPQDALSSAASNNTSATTAAASDVQSQSDQGSASTQGMTKAAERSASSLQSSDDPCGPSSLRSLSICDLDNALMARMHHLLHAPHVHSSLLSLQVSHSNTRPHFLRSLAQVSALTSLRLAHMWGLAAADELRFSLSHLSELRVLHLSQLHLSMCNTPEATQRPLQPPLSQLTDLKLSCTDITTCHALCIPVFRAAPLSTLQELSVGYSISQSGLLNDSIAAWPPDSHLTHLDACTVWLNALAARDSPVFERLVTLKCESAQKWAEVWPQGLHPAMTIPGTLPESGWTILQTMRRLKDLELSDLSDDEQNHALRSLTRSHPTHLKRLQLSYSPCSAGLVEFLACEHVSLTSLCVSAHTLSDWTIPEEIAVFQELVSHTTLRTLTWDISESSHYFGQLPETVPLRDQKDMIALHMALQQLSSLQGLTELVLNKLQALGGPVVSTGNSLEVNALEAALMLPNLCTLACDLGPNLILPEVPDGCHGGSTTAAASFDVDACISDDLGSLGNECSSSSTVCKAPQHQLSVLAKLEKLQLRIHQLCPMQLVVSLLGTPRLCTRLRLLSLSDIPLHGLPDTADAPFPDTQLLEVISKYTALEELHFHAAPATNGASSHVACEGTSQVVDMPRTHILHVLLSGDGCVRRPVPFCSYFKNLRRLQALVLNGVGAPGDVEEVVRLGLPLQRGIVYMGAQM